VARHYDGWLPFLPEADGYGRAWRQLRANLADAGRPADAVTPGLYATITVNGDKTAARAELEHYIQHYYGRSLEQMAAIQAYCWGSPDECADWLAGYVRAGARHIVIRVGSLEPEAQLKEIAEVVLPAVRAPH
jgi:alkanesulfonate monooxygenase SsuD/methylene tetrahydromethanopterin reductase-like flavin-dependent oxidoreductase (luciferase family)